MQKSSAYRNILPTLPEWEPYLLAESGLPGPRGNLELAFVVAELGAPEFFRRCLAYTAELAPTNTPEEFLAFCGALGHGRLLLEGDPSAPAILQACANDLRWRTREAAAMALQIVGDRDMPRAIQIAREWSRGTRLEQRAAAAALCEPRLLKQVDSALATLEILNAITATLPGAEDRLSENFKTLRQGLGYCWSVAVAALPNQGKKMMEKWLTNPNPDIRWLMRENLKKNRMQRMDAEWTSEWTKRLNL